MITITLIISFLFGLASLIWGLIVLALPVYAIIYFHKGIKLYNYKLNEIEQIEKITNRPRD